MTLDARHRSSIYQKLIPVLGESDANALMSQFPASEADELVTKQLLRAELAELRGEIAGMETRLTLRIGAAAVAQTTILGALLLLI
ncbi:MAG: hypothetical protein ACO1PW_07735 [Actinomycetota bacterium]